MNVHSSFIWNSSKLVTTQLPVSRCLHKYPYSGVLLDNKKDHKREPNNMTLNMIMLREKTQDAPLPKVHFYEILKKYDLI